MEVLRHAAGTSPINVKGEPVVVNVEQALLSGLHASHKTRANNDGQNFKDQEAKCSEAYFICVQQWLVVADVRPKRQWGCSYTAANFI